MQTATQVRVSDTHQLPAQCGNRIDCDRTEV